MRPKYSLFQWIFPALLLLALLLAALLNHAFQMEARRAPESPPAAASQGEKTPRKQIPTSVYSAAASTATPPSPLLATKTNTSTPTAILSASPVAPLTLHPETRIALLLGVDRDSPEIGLTDAIIVIFYNLKFERASLLSLPRDWLVTIPGHGPQRINTAYRLGGIELVNATLQHHLGAQASRWAVIHLDDFQNFVDDLGGIKIAPTHGVNDPWCQVAEGKSIQMSGYLALCYARSRSGASDLARNQRQQQVFAAILKEVGRPGNLARLPEFHERYHQSIQTNISLLEMLEHTPLLLRLRENERIAYHHLGWEDVRPWQMPESRDSVLLIQSERLQAIAQRALRFILSP